MADTLDRRPSILGIAEPTHFDHFKAGLDSLEIGNIDNDLLDIHAAIGDHIDDQFRDGLEEEQDDEDDPFGDHHHEFGSSPLIRALRGDPAPRAHHHGLHERQLVAAWRTLETPTWTPERQMLAVVHKLWREHGMQLVTVKFVMDQYEMTVPQAFVEPVITEPPPVHVRHLKKGEPIPTAEEAMRQHPYFSAYTGSAHLPPPGPPSQVPGLPQQPQHQHFMHSGSQVSQNEPMTRFPLQQNTAQALRNRSIPVQTLTYDYGEHFYSKLYENNFYKDRGMKPDERRFYLPLSGGLYEQTTDGSLVPVERLPDGSIRTKESLMPDTSGYSID